MPEPDAAVMLRHYHAEVVAIGEEDWKRLDKLDEGQQQISARLAAIEAKLDALAKVIGKPPLRNERTP